jgi:hypothetical protein
MRHGGTRPLVRRMQAIDQALRARKWPTDKTLARDLEVDPRTIRRDLEFERRDERKPVSVQSKRRKLSQHQLFPSHLHLIRSIDQKTR